AELRLLNRRHRAAHLDLALRARTMTDICLAHARYYAEHGHADARYVPNLYPDRGGDASRVAREPGKLFGSSGDAGATRNQSGLWYLGREVVPALRRRLGTDGFRVHVYGHSRAGEPVERALEHPEVIRRGWVESLDDEIRSVQAVLLLNNAGAYQGVY